ncbi:hypothetical protein BOO86_27870 [Mycobacterium sp. CBMA 234]|uniref:type VII secretion target n=1 Tax=Mycolicibacterium sp. CBMA 234 TaxID=1918495 RepID=UPI0012DE3219|nr:type VII secretion target [Mycolicibacterium sp. CBMA 234]MUL68317.1 hypothetical protein [Mycolicibacterium sp. CBMA 234]
MAGVLRVDPKALRDAAHAQTGVATFISTMAVGESLTSAGDGLSGLHSEAMCRTVGELFDTETSAAHGELTAHAEKLSTAAGMYLRTDKEHGERIDKLVR